MARDETAAKARVMFQTFRVQLGFPEPDIAGLDQLSDGVLDSLSRRDCISACGATWVKARLNSLIIRPPKCGKTTLACAMGSAALAAGEWPRYITVSDCVALVSRGVPMQPIWGLLESDVFDTELVIVNNVLPEALTSVQCEALVTLLTGRHEISTLLIVQAEPNTQFDQLRWRAANAQLATWFAKVPMSLRLGQTDFPRQMGDAV